MGYTGYRELKTLGGQYMVGHTHKLNPNNWTFIPYGSFSSIQLGEEYFLSPLTTPLIKVINTNIYFSDLSEVN